MPESIHHLFRKKGVMGKEFAKLWNSKYKDGIQNELAEHFKMSVATVSRIRRELGLPTLHAEVAFSFLTYGES